MGQLSGIALDPRLQTPLYQQVFDQVVHRIRTGVLPVGFRLPPTRTLAEEIRAHRNTVVRAYEDLETAGFVISQVGRGTFVAEAPRVATEAPALRTTLPWAQLTSRA